jgi:hypothetical protein
LTREWRPREAGATGRESAAGCSLSAFTPERLLRAEVDEERLLFWDLEIVQCWSDWRQEAVGDGADALSRRAAVTVEEERRRGNALLQDASLQNRFRE